MRDLWVEPLNPRFKPAKCRPNIEFKTLITRSNLVWGRFDSRIPISLSTPADITRPVSGGVSCKCDPPHFRSAQHNSGGSHVPRHPELGRPLAFINLPKTSSTSRSLIFPELSPSASPGPPQMGSQDEEDTASVLHPWLQGKYTHSLSSPSQPSPVVPNAIIIITLPPHQY